MWPFNRYPYTDFHELNADWILRKITELDYKVKTWLKDVTPTITETVNKWLDDHPEATTTVQDGSITTIKFKHDSIPFYNVVDYGINPDSGDVYSDLYDFIVAYPYLTGGIVYFPKGKYTLSSTIFIPENTTFIGDGVETEIYFDETDTYFGTGLANAGSNVSIKNMKVSQRSHGIFATGAQPGCIGFSNWAKEQAAAGKYTRQMLRGEVYNLTVEDIISDGFYPLQTEPSTDSSMHNIIYKNIYAPTGCVSAVSQSNIENLNIENVVCDLFRISVVDAGILTNVFANNIVCQNFGIANPNSEASIIINNLTQTDAARRNTNTGNNNGVVNGNVNFRNCVFTAINPEINGIGLFNGIIAFYECIFNMYDRIARRESSLSTDNYMVAESCTFNSVQQLTEDPLIGYGHNNIVNASNVRNLLWGDIHGKYINGIGINGVTSSVPTELYVNGDTVSVKGYGIPSNGMTMFDAGSRITALPLSESIYQIVIWSSTVGRGSTTYATFAKFENDSFSVIEGEMQGSTGFDRFNIDIELQLTRTPTPEEIYNAFF